MREEVANRDQVFGAAGEGGEIARDRRIEVEPVFIVEDHRGGGSAHHFC